MIHKISISNYQSIRDQVTLDFRVPRTTPQGSWLRRPAIRPNLRVPAAIALIGPNGSGKTACLRALANTIRFALESFGYQPGAIDGFVAFASDEALSKPTRVEIEFDAPWWLTDAEEQNRLFRYTLELLRGTPSLLADSVGYEALHDFPLGRRRRLIERCVDRPIHVAKEMSISPNDDRLASIPANASVLSTLSRMGVQEFQSIVDSLMQVQMNVSAIDPIRLPVETL